MRETLRYFGWLAVRLGTVAALYFVVRALSQYGTTVAVLVVGACVLLLVILNGGRRL